MKCSVIDCKSDNEGKACNVSFFTFPTDPALRKKWISFCRRGKKIFPRSYICMLHFKPEDIENRLQYEMGLANKRYLKRDAFPTITTAAIENAEQLDERASRIEKRENKKIVESILKAYEAEENAKLHEEPEANINDYVEPTDYVSEMSIEKYEPASGCMDEHNFDTKSTTDYSDNSQQQLVKTKATQTESMDDEEYACACVTVTRNFLAYNFKCFHCDARFSIHDWDELMNHIESKHRLKMEAQFEAAADDENKALSPTFSFVEETDDDTLCLQFEENDMQNVSALNPYPTGANEHINEYLKLKTERPKTSRKRKQNEISKEKCSNLDFDIETSDAQLVFYIIDLLHSDPTLWFIDGIKTKQYKNGLRNLYTKIREKYELMDQEELHECLIIIRDWYQRIFKQKKSDQLSYPQSEYYCKLAKFLPEGLNEKTCERCERTFEDHLQYFAHKKMDHAENDNEEAEEISLVYLKENLTDYFQSRYRRIPPGQLYECRICFKKYNRRNKLIDHVRTHLDIRDLVCHICGKTFIQKHNFAAHKRRHYGLRRYKCLICEKAFTTYTSLTFHRTGHHRPIEGTIEEIEKNPRLHCTLPRRKRTKGYISYTDGSRTCYACPFCEETFANRRGAQRHYNKIHRIELEVKETTENIPKI